MVQKYGFIRNIKEWSCCKKIYIKWILRLESCTPDYILRREMKLQKLTADAIKRAGGYKNKLNKLIDGDIRKEIWLKKKNKIGEPNRYDLKSKNLKLKMYRENKKFKIR